MPKLSDYVVQFVADQGVKHVFLATGAMLAEVVAIEQALAHARACRVQCRCVSSHTFRVW